MKNWNAKIFAIIGVSCNAFKLLLSIIGIFLFFHFSVIAGGLILNGFELFFTFVNLVLLTILTVITYNGKIIRDSNQAGKILCIIALSLSGLIIVLRIILFILGLVFYIREVKLYNDYMDELEYLGINIYKKISVGDWILLIIPTLIVFIIEIIHFWAVNYLYKLIKIPTDLSYNDYLNNGQNVEQVSNTTTIQVNQNPQGFPFNNPNQIPSSNQQNETNKNIN